MQRDDHDRWRQRTPELSLQHAAGRQIAAVHIVQPRRPHDDHRARVFSHLADASSVHFVAHEV